MTKIIGTIKEFKSMFEMIMCGNKYPLFDSVVLEIDGDVISVCGIDSTRSVMTDQKYTGFSIGGDVNIPVNTIAIIEAIKLFDDTGLLTLDYVDNKIILSVDSEDKNDTITIPAPSIEMSKIPININGDSISVNGSEMIFDGKFVVDTADIRNQIKRANYVSPMYHEYLIGIDGNKLTLTIGDVNNFETSSSTEIKVDGEGSANAKYIHGYEDIFKSLSGDVTIKMSSDKPMFIIQEKDNYSVKYLVAPAI